MLPNSKYKQAGQNIFLSSAQGLANMLAIIAAFLGTPPIYNASKDWVHEFAFENYGESLADFTTLCWWLISALTIFFISRMTISAALMSAAIMLVMRFAV